MEITITEQAKKVLHSAKYSEEEFKDWILKTQQASFGGGHVMLFLESKYNDKESS